MTQHKLNPFSISVNEEVLIDLRTRINRTRWPDQIPGTDWSQGTDLVYLRQLLTYWANEFNWRAQEQELNKFNHFRTNIDGAGIHFVHAKARNGKGIPLIVTHGWPSTFLEMLPLVPLLTDPSAHDIEGPSFDLVIPSLPGYAFSDRPTHTGVNYRFVAGIWHKLMCALGYEKYGAGGTDFGSGVATLMGLDNPDKILGVHLSTLDISPYTGPGSRPLSKNETVFLAATQKWDDVERGYSAIQSTKPQTLGYGLNDSPAGLAAWIIEKWRSWSDCQGDLESHVSRDFLLTMLTLYWVTQTITSSIRDYVTVSAKSINLYSEPKTDSKVAATMNTEAGVTIVYTPKSGEWIKVANPTNGDVGWVKSSDLGRNGYNMRVFTSDNGTHRYSVYQLGTGNSQL